MHVLALTLATLAAASSQPHVVGTPSVSYRVVDRAVSIGATVRLNRPFGSTAELHRYSIVAAPHLRTGQKLAGELYGGSALGRLRTGSKGAWYAAEAVQLKKRSSVKPGARWQVALARGGRIVGAVKTVALRRG